MLAAVWSASFSHPVAAIFSNWLCVCSKLVIFYLFPLGRWNVWSDIEKCLVRHLELGAIAFAHREHNSVQIIAIIKCVLFFTCWHSNLNIKSTVRNTKPFKNRGQLAHEPIIHLGPFTGLNLACGSIHLTMRRKSLGAKLVWSHLAKKFEEDSHHLQNI